MPQAKLIDVLIVGGGPVGVSLAVELSLFGIKSTIIERHPSPLKLPRGQLLNPRSMEILDRLGVATQIEDAVLLPKTFFTGFTFCSGLNGDMYAELPLNDGGNLQSLTAKSFQRLPLWITEEILRNRAVKSNCIDLQTGFDVTSLQYCGDFVRVIAKTQKEEKEFHAKYVIGCDGANSFVRTSCQIPFVGDSNLSFVQQIVFEAPLNKLMNMKLGSFYYIFGKKMFGGIGAIDGKMLWVAQIPIYKEDPPNKAKMILLLKELTGIDCEFKILRDRVWELGSQVAERFQYKDRILLAGDAVHRISPTGGHGLNLGFGDIINLGWKIAATLMGWGGNKLLQSYSLERKPVAQLLENNSKTNFLKVKEIHEKYPPEIDQKQFEEAILKLSTRYDALGATLGYSYSESPIIIRDFLTNKPEFDECTYTPSSYPGSMAPHVILADGSALSKQFGYGLNLLCFVADDYKSVENLAKQRNIPLKIVMITDEKARNLYGADFVVFRPDYHVAWRGNDLLVKWDDIFDQILGY